MHIIQAELPSLCSLAFRTVFLCDDYLSNSTSPKLLLSLSCFPGLPDYCHE
uniref:Uncharacterized protein n=1 Tax=Picea glauca TaxID=3330 RepID=A0A101M085_PICGL|nr:hypothetical protein ABT39_MTgene4564 [Picea glauca]